MKFTISIPTKMNLDLRKFYVFEKRNIVIVSYTICVMLLFYGSLHPWIFWILKDYYKVLAGCFGFMALVIDNSCEKRQLIRKNVLIPTLLFLFFSMWVDITHTSSISSYPTDLFTAIAVLAAIRANDELLAKVFNLITKITAGFLIVSLIFFLLYLIGFPLPYVNVSFNDGQYTFSNYFFFLLDDRDLEEIIPRFHSILLEPGHLAGCTCFLLMTQLGNWKKWYSIVLIFTSLVTFSLASYAFLVALIFLNMWVQGKQIIKTLAVVAVLLGLGSVVAINYNDGDNLVNNLILLRLEVDDKTGDIQGNNRVSEGFEHEFDKFMASSDVLVGRDFQKVNDNHGNSGYRVFIYSNGMIGTIIIFLLYFYFFREYKDIRCLTVAIIMFLMMFWSRGYPQWFCYLLPLLKMVRQDFKYKRLKTKEIQQ